ncbi:MAG: exodeoxyribonuclease VII large subunit [Termitinemataceae bacterium]|nr:MAG: exodeoxyribonuclease VII large subunit [Termitinemataceae bacterium]
MIEKKFTVSEITSLIKKQLEVTFNSVIVEGELSNCKFSSTGHFYWTLKDSSAAISGVIFKGSLRYLSCKPKDGMLVRSYGRISVYPQNGTYQIIAENMEAAGEGDILAMLQARKEKLKAEGIFDEEHKRALPRFPERVAVVSSPTGSVVRDILNVLHRRAAGLNVIVLPTPVQGADAAAIIARRIEQVGEMHLADVMIVGRGGGSLEDLLPFSAENVVRAAYNSIVPVVSAVGHETDWSLLDYAADLRSPTPSAAAELVSEDYSGTLNAVRGFSLQMHRSIEERLSSAALLLKPFSREYLQRQFLSILQPRLLRLDDAKEELLDALQIRVRDLKHRFEIAYTMLEASNPKKIMERGFSIVVNKRTNKIIKKPKDAKAGDPLQIQTAGGKLTAEAG